MSDHEQAVLPHCTLMCGYYQGRRHLVTQAQFPGGQRGIADVGTFNEAMRSSYFVRPMAAIKVGATTLARIARDVTKF